MGRGGHTYAAGGAAFFALTLILSGCGEKYPANVETNFLNACELRASVAACGCALDWLEGHVTLAQFQSDDYYAQRGIITDDMRSALTACT